MTTKISEIANEIKETLKPEVEKWEVETFNYVKKMEHYCKIEVFAEAKTLGVKGAYVIYDLKVKKGWHVSLNKFFDRSEKDLKAIIAKEAQAKLTKIDVAVNKLLKNEEIVTVEKLGFTFNSANQFCEGSWKINGNKTFSFRAIYAGGYNIQTLHVRTLYSYK